MPTTSDAYRAPVARLTHVRCAYGGTGVSPAGYCAIRSYFEVAVGAASVHLAVSGIELIDTNSGAIIARAGSPVVLRISPPGRDRDHNEITAPFSGDIDAGVVQRLCAATDFAALPPTLEPSSCRYRAVVVVTCSGHPATFALEGPLDDPWPTAGPSLHKRSRVSA